MAKTTAIPWSRSTFNPWIGCTEVSNEANGGGGCDGCYARELDKRHRYGGAEHWGAGVPRFRTSLNYWAQPAKWNDQAARELRTGEVDPRDADKWSLPGFWPVFPSMCDPFDNEVPTEWHADLWRTIRATPFLTWLLLTKRVGNVAKMHPGGEYPNVWIGASIVNQKEADRDIPKLLEVPAAKRFVSYEPALGPVDFTRWLGKQVCCGNAQQVNGGGFDEPPEFECCREGIPGVDQVIVGGESSQGKHRARPFDLAWARSTVAQCRAAGVPVFVKQLGSRPIDLDRLAAQPHLPGDTIIGEPTAAQLERLEYLIEKGSVRLHDRAGADPSEWPDDLRLQEFPA